MDRAHRQELKHDKFVEQVGHTFEYATEHKKQFSRYGIAALAILVIAAGIYFYRDSQHTVRQAALREALRTQDAQIGPADPNGFYVTFPTQEERDKAVEKSWKELASKYSGSDEGLIARFYLGAFYADRGNASEAEKYLKEAANGGDKNFASQAKLSLAQLYAATNRSADAEKILRDLEANPTVMVSKEQAQIALARVIGKTKPDEARKLLEPLRTASGAVSRSALTAISELPGAR